MSEANSGAPRPVDSDPAAPLHERFEIRDRIGAGGMGVVYSAYDQQRDEIVALKTLHEQDPRTLYAFKREFRALIGVAHRNLVSLYELIAEDEHCFFTMELVDGVSFIDYVRPGAEVPASEDEEQPSSTALTKTLPLEAAPEPFDPDERRLPSPYDGSYQAPAPGFDEARLREALAQLVEGVAALHNAGKVHRDLKPQNVLVNRDGRVVILDFGIVQELAPSLAQLTAEAGFPGTLPYMSPEQARGENTTTASDWYSVGTILFEALTGLLPFSGSISKVLTGKLHHTAPSPSVFVEGLPRDLVELCEQLLERDVAQRPAAANILARLGLVDAALPDQSYLRIRSPEEALLVGREPHLATLEECFRESQRGRAVSLHVHGTSGMGKTTLVHAFLRQLIRDRRAVVLPGRCYARELVPYKALDGVIDSLAKYLLKLPRQEVELLLPEDIRALAQLFPVLKQISAIADAPTSQKVADRSSLRRQAFLALRQLLWQLTARQPLVLYIDDLQWADADSTALLSDLSRPPDPPPILLLTSFRSEEIGSQAFLADLLVLAGESSSQTLAIEPLDDVEAGRLAIGLLGDVADRQRLAQAVVREARGNPFLIEQLARYAADDGNRLDTTEASAQISLAQMLEARIAGLPAGSEELLLILATAGRPIATKVAHRAAGLSGDERPLVAALDAAQMVRHSGSAETVELYHDRIRETLAGRVDPAKAVQLHLRLAATLVEQGAGDPEALFTHYRSAGEIEKAASQALAAAQRASQTLAFDRAALFYLRALDLGSFEPARRLELRRELAESLAQAGRPGDAAAIFLELAEAEQGVGAQRLEWRAAQEYLAGGYFDEGLAVLRKVLGEVGFNVPESTSGALLSLIWQRLRLRWRGYDFEPRDAAEIAEEELLRIDTSWIASAALITSDPIRGTDFQTRQLRLALTAGETSRIARALCLEVSYRATRGLGARQLTRRILDRAKRIAQELEDPYVAGQIQLHAGIRAYCFGEWQKAEELSWQAASHFLEKCPGAQWEVTAARRYALATQTYLGKLAEVVHRVPIFLAEADERGNVQASAQLRTRLGISWLAMDDPDRTHREAEKALRMWSREGFQIIHFAGLMSRCQADLYSGHAAEALERLLAQWPRMRRLYTARIQVARIEALFLRGRCALAAAGGSGSRRLLRLAAQSASRLEDEGCPYALPMAQLITAGCAHLRGNARCIDLLRRAETGFINVDMQLHATAARWRRAQLADLTDPADEATMAGAWMARQKIARPERWRDMLAPGFADL